MSNDQETAAVEMEQQETREADAESADDSFNDTLENEFHLNITSMIPRLSLLAKLDVTAITSPQKRRLSGTPNLNPMKKLRLDESLTASVVDVEDGEDDTPATEQLTKRQRQQQKIKDYATDDDGWEVYSPSAKMYGLMQREGLQNLKKFVKPIILPDRNGFLIKITDKPVFSQKLKQEALAKGWDVFHQCMRAPEPRSSKYREAQKNGDKSYWFDDELAAAANAYREVTNVFLHFLKECIKQPSFFYGFISIPKTRRCAYVAQLFDSQGEPYRTVFHLSIQLLMKNHPKASEPNIFKLLYTNELKQIVADALHKERTCRKKDFLFDDESDEETGGDGPAGGGGDVSSATDTPSVSTKPTSSAAASDEDDE